MEVRLRVKLQGLKKCNQHVSHLLQNGLDVLSVDFTCSAASVLGIFWYKLVISYPGVDPKIRHIQAVF